VPVSEESEFDPDGNLKRDLSSGIEADIVKAELIIAAKTGNFKREMFGILKKRTRTSNVSDDVRNIILVLAIALRAYYESGVYFRSGNGGAVQGLFIQDAPLQPPTNPQNAVLQCMNGRVRLLPMTQQSQLTTAISQDYRPQTEHLMDVSWPLEYRS
jgi:hypothetical protein